MFLSDGVVLYIHVLARVLAMLPVDLFHSFELSGFGHGFLQLRGLKWRHTYHCGTSVWVNTRRVRQRKDRCLAWYPDD